MCSKCQRESWKQQGYKQLRPVEDDVRADSRQAESEAGVTAVSPLTVREGSGFTAQHVYWWNTLGSTHTFFVSLVHGGSPCLLLVAGGWRTQVPPRVFRVPELQGGYWGQGYLCLSGEIQTVLVRDFVLICFENIFEKVQAERTCQIVGYHLWTAAD